MSVEDLEKQVRASGSLIERLKSCNHRIGKMCSEGRPPKMSIPVQWDDDDFYIGVTLRDAIESMLPSINIVPNKKERGQNE